MTGQASPDGQVLTSDRLLNHARALRLETQLKLRTVVEESDRLGADVEIVYEHVRQASSAIRPITVRVGRDASDADVLAHGGITAACRRYNAALARLHDLAARLAELEGRFPFESDPDLDHAHQVLPQLDGLTGRRQALYMGCNVVLLATLRSEIEFFESYDDRMAPAIVTAERTAALLELGGTTRPSEIPSANPPPRWRPEGPRS